MQQWVQASRANAIPVPGQFLDHAEPEDRLFGRVVEEVQPDHAGQKIPITHGAAAPL
jgi:hypothetical protein